MLFLGTQRTCFCTGRRAEIHLDNCWFPAAEIHLDQLQHLMNTILINTDNIPRIGPKSIYILGIRKGYMKNMKNLAVI